jgi:RNA polymerase primary sigma factor
VTLQQDVDAVITETLPHLIELGRPRGYVTESEVKRHLPEAEDDPDLLDLVESHLGDAELELFRETEGAEDTTVEVVDTRPTSLDGIDSDDTISLYFREVGSVPLLTRDDEVSLAMRIEAGTKARDLLMEARGLSSEERWELERVAEDGQMAWDHLVKANSRLVISMAKKYRGQVCLFWI